MECKCIYCGETIPEGMPMCWRCAKNLHLGMKYCWSCATLSDCVIKQKKKAIKEYKEKKNDIERSN